VSFVDAGDKLITGVMESMKIWDKAYSIVASVNATCNNLSPGSTTPAIIYHLWTVVFTPVNSN
jgi:hypothetical protein